MKDLQPLISIIVPFYNADSTILRCAESIMKQTFESFEVIFVNDGSSEFAGGITELSKKFTVINKKNGGVSSARNYGLNSAKGKYIVFCDADDFIEPYYLEDLMRGVDQNADISYVGIASYNLDTEIKDAHITTFKNDDIELDAIDSLKIVRYNLLAVGYPYGKLYKRSIIEENEIRFDERINNHEDHLFYLDYLRYCNSAHIESRVSYYYTYRHCSYSLSHRVPNYRHLLIASDGFLQRFTFFFEKYAINDKHYITKLISEYGLGSRRSAIYSLYHSKQPKITRLKVIKEQAVLFRNWQKLYCYNPAKWKHKFIYSLLASPVFTSNIKDKILCKIYHLK